MNAPQKNPQDTSSSDFTGTWRYKAGISLFVLGNIGVLLGVILPIIGLAPQGGGAGFVGAMIVGGEVVAMTSIVFLGKAGFVALKNKMFGAVKTGYVTPVGPVRHYVGIALFLLNAFCAYFIIFYAWKSFESATPENPIVWGLELSEQWNLIASVFLVGEVGFLVSLYVLGADWWERFRGLFVWRAPDRTPSGSS